MATSCSAARRFTGARTGNFIEYYDFVVCGYTGLSLRLTISVPLLGGTALLIMIFLISRSGNPAAPAFVVIVGAIVSLMVALLARETTHTDLLCRLIAERKGA